LTSVVLIAFCGERETPWQNRVQEVLEEKRRAAF
jgi:hypothetical protein